MLAASSTSSSSSGSGGGRSLLTRGSSLASRWDSMDENVILFINCNLMLNKECFHSCKLAIKGSKIVDIFIGKQDDDSNSRSQTASQEEAIIVVDCGGAFISPGFIDWQINGASGIDFSCDDNGLSLTSGVSSVAAVLVTRGVTSFCPTVVTCPLDVYQRNLTAYKPIRGGKHGANALKLHLEGPVLSEAKKGAHRLSLLKPPDSLNKLYGNGIDFKSTVGIVTIAAELEGACEMTKRLKEDDPDVVVSIGHSNATFAQAENMIRAGATSVTHLFNCLSNLNNRDPGVIGLLGSNSHLPIYFGIIADGIHVHPASLQMAQKCARDTLTLVTDAISSAGLPDGEHTVADQKITIANGKAVVTATGVLVGSTVFLDECVRVHMAATMSSLAVSAYAASTASANLLGLSNKGVLKRGADADMTLLTAAGEVIATIVQGDIAFCSPDRW